MYNTKKQMNNYPYSKEQYFETITNTLRSQNLNKQKANLYKRMT